MRKYGCFDRAPLKSRVEVQSGWEQGGRRMIVIPDPLTKHCNYSLTELGKVDPLCDGCIHKEQA